jgi:hypothetical protein
MACNSKVARLAPTSKTSQRFVGSPNTEVFERFELFRQLMEKIYGVDLSSAKFVSPRQLSLFCTGLIEGDSEHPWRQSVGSLSAQNRLGFKHSLFLFRKVIPKDKPSVLDYIRRLSEPQEDPDADFLAYARKLVRKIFPAGWDRTYVRHTIGSSLPLTACAERGRADGGSRCFQAWERTDRTEFCEYVLDAVTPKDRGVSRVSAIDTGGKWRVIATPPEVDNALRPLHKAMYSHLSTQGWLLRGDAKPKSFSRFTPVEGEVFVSGDYESATDNLNATLQKALLEEMFLSAESIPQGIKQHTLDTYSSQLTANKRDDKDQVLFTQRRGQLMGQLTSFPLLCLVNYITFKYSVPRKGVPVRINGDDIVFRCTPEEYETWADNVSKGGLTLCKGKTFVHRRGFTLNSTPFWATSKGAKAVGFLRPSAIWKQGDLEEQIRSLHGRYYSSCAGYGRLRREMVRTFLLKQNEKCIHASRRSISRGLELAVTRKMLHDLGMWHRELYYLEQVVERKVPPLKKTELPAGWIQLPRNVMSQEDIDFWQSEWSWACTEYAWTGDFRPQGMKDPDNYRVVNSFGASGIIDGCPPYGLGSLIGPRVRKMLKMSRSQIWRWVFKRQNEGVFGRVHWGRGKGVWVLVDQLATRSLVTHAKFVLASS